jgi:hypothetical protein
MSLRRVSRWLTVCVVIGLAIAVTTHVAAAVDAKTAVSVATVAEEMQVAAEPCDRCAATTGLSSPSCQSFCHGAALVLPTVVEIDCFESERMAGVLISRLVGRDRRPDPHPPRTSTGH